MLPTDNDPKGNDPVDRDPTNEEIVAYLQRDSMHFCKVIHKNIGKPPSRFEFRTDFFQGMPHHFQAMFVDMKDYKVLCTTTADEFDKYPRAKALKSLLFDQCFPNVEAFAVACRNALGDNIETFDLAGCIFVDGQGVDEIIDALDAKAFEKKQLAVEVKELAAEVKTDDKQLASPAEDKTDDKQLASPAEDKADDKQLASPAEDKTDEKVNKIQLMYAEVFLQFFCEQQAMQTVS